MRAEVSGVDEKADELVDIVESVEKKTGWKFCPKEVHDILRHTIRKCELNGKGEDYIPVLFENELRDYLMRLVINARGAMNHVRHLSQNAV